MKHIVVPTDFSENAWSAFQYAQVVFGREPCRFHLLHAYRKGKTLADEALRGPGEAFGEPWDHVWEKLENWKTRIESDDFSPHNELELHAFGGLLVYAITETLAEVPVDFIVMGNHRGYRGKGNLYGQQCGQGGTEPRALSTFGYSL